MICIIEAYNARQNPKTAPGVHFDFANTVVTMFVLISPHKLYKSESKHHLKVHIGLLNDLLLNG